MTTPAERPLLLNVLRGDRLLCKLVSTWPLVTRPEGWELKRETREKVMREWASISGTRVSYYDVRDAWRTLIRTGIVRMDGTCDPRAEQWAFMDMVEDMPKRMRERTLAQMDLQDAAAKAKGGA